MHDELKSKRPRAEADVHSIELTFLRFRSFGNFKEFESGCEHCFSGKAGAYSPE